MVVILERLFFQIINSNSDKKNEVKLVPEMLNLLGCNKDNFLKLIKKMNYKSYKIKDEFYFKYSPNRVKIREYDKNNINNDNPFSILKKINFK